MPRPAASATCCCAGAAQVIALDVGHGQLDSRIARDPRIIEMSGVNIRDVTAANLPYHRT